MADHPKTDLHYVIWGDDPKLIHPKFDLRYDNICNVRIKAYLLRLNTIGSCQDSRRVSPIDIFNHDIVIDRQQIVFADFVIVHHFILSHIFFILL